MNKNIPITFFAGCLAFSCYLPPVYLFTDTKMLPKFFRILLLFLATTVLPLHAQQSDEATFVHFTIAIQVSIIARQTTIDQQELQIMTGHLQRKHHFLV